MKLSQPTNLRVEDYPDEAKWIGRLFIVLNSFFTSVQQVIDQNVDYTSNIRSITREYDSLPLSVPVTFAWTYTQADPMDLRITKATRDGVSTLLMPAWSFDASTREITISEIIEMRSGAVAAISSAVRYKFTVRATV